MFLAFHIALILMFTTLKDIIENQLLVNSSKLSTILRPRAKFAITNYDSLYVSLLCFLYLLQVELYNSELSSIMIYVLLYVMLLVRILLSTLHSINLRSCLLSSVSLGDKRSLSLGELIRPFCITILCLNSLLFIDIFHIERWYLCYFICFCMVDDFWSMDRCSQDSDGNGAVWRQNSRRSENPGKYTENPIFPEDEGS